MADMRHLLETCFGRRSQPGFRRRTGCSHQSDHLRVRAVERRKELAPRYGHRRIALADRLSLAIPGPGLCVRWHIFDQLEHVGEAAHAVLVAAGEEAVLAEHRAAIGPQPAGP